MTQTQMKMNFLIAKKDSLDHHQIGHQLAKRHLPQKRRTAEIKRRGGKWPTRKRGKRRGWVEETDPFAAPLRSTDLDELFHRFFGDIKKSWSGTIVGSLVHRATGVDEK